MLFKFLTGKELGQLQTGMILSQLGGFLLVFTGLFLIFPTDSIVIHGGPPLVILLIAGLIKLVAPILVGKGIKIAFWLVIVLCFLKLVESVLATLGNNPVFLWYLAVTGIIEIGALIHLLHPKAREELKSLV